MARPKKKIDPEQVQKLAAINCSYAEIGAIVGCDSSTLTRRFAQDIEKGREIGKSSLKRKMWDIAMNNNVTMCIWLSKQMLGYTDKVEQKTEANVTQTSFEYKTTWGGNFEPGDTKDPETL
jgi:hypothetical protein